jgi:hypothetical protein
VTGVTNNLTAGLTLENTTIQTLLTELPDKARIGLMLPVRKTVKEESDDSGLLSTPLPKRQKSPIGDIIKRGRAKQDNVGEEEEDSNVGIKEEVLFKEELGIKEEGFSDIDSFPAVADLLGS